MFKWGFNIIFNVGLFHYSQFTKWAMKCNILWIYYFPLLPIVQWFNWKQEWTSETFNDLLF